MAGLTAARANAYLDDSWGTATRTAPTTPMKMTLETTAGTATAAGTEATGGPGPYARQTITMAAAAAQANASNAPVSFAGMPAGTYVGTSVFGSEGTPVRHWWGPLAANKVAQAGDTIAFATGAVTSAISS